MRVPATGCPGHPVAGAAALEPLDGPGCTIFGRFGSGTNACRGPLARAGGLRTRPPRVLPALRPRPVKIGRGLFASRIERREPLKPRSLTCAITWGGGMQSERFREPVTVYLKQSDGVVRPTPLTTTEDKALKERRRAR